MKSNKYNIDKNIKQDVLSEEERKEIIVPAQKTLEQKKDSTWDNAVINGIHVNYKLVAPKDNNLSIASICFIDDTGNGFLFTSKCTRIESYCIPIVNNKIMSNKCYDISSPLFKYYDDRSVSSAIECMATINIEKEKIKQNKDNNALINNSNSLINVKNSNLNKIFTNLAKVCRPLLQENIVEQPGSNYKILKQSNDDYEITLKTSANNGFFVPKDEIQIQSKKLGHSKVYYSDGKVKTTINKGGIINEYVENNNPQLFSQLKLLINKNKMNSLYQMVSFLFNKPEITVKNGFTILKLTNGYTVSFRTKPQTAEQQQSILIKDLNNNGKCYYADGYMNPVVDNETTINGSKKVGKQHLETLKQLINEGRYEALNNLCEELLTNNIDNNVNWNLYNNEEKQCSK